FTLDSLPKPTAVRSGPAAQRPAWVSESTHESPKLRPDENRCAFVDVLHDIFQRNLKFLAIVLRFHVASVRPDTLSLKTTCVQRLCCFAFQNAGSRPNRQIPERQICNLRNNCIEGTLPLCWRQFDRFRNNDFR